MKARRIISNIVVYAILVVMSIIWLLPIAWLALQSFGGDLLATGATKLIPDTWTFNNYIQLFTNTIWDGSPSKYTYLNWIFNTLIVSLVSCLISTLLVLCTSFAFSRLRFKGRTAMMKVILVLGMFPGFLGMIVLYQILDLLQLTKQLSIVGLTLCYVGGAGMGYYICKGFFDTISKSIDEAAMVDGASRFQIFIHIIIPLSKPIIIYTLLTSFIAPWGEYITSSYLLGTSGTQNWTVAVGLYDMIKPGPNQNFQNYWKQFCAGSVFIAVPISALFIIMQKYYVGGVTGGAVKG